MRKWNSLRLSVPALFAAAVLSTPGAWAAHPGSDHADDRALDRVNDATKLVEKMKQDPALARMIDHAFGIFVVPHYGHGAILVGGQGGGGVVLSKHAGEWSDPAFFDIGGGGIGLAAGASARASGAAAAMILLTRNALHYFENGGSWSLNGNAGLTVVTWSARAQAGRSKSDVVIWSDTVGLYGGLSASATSISADTKLDQAFYQRHTDSRQILRGRVDNPDANLLRNALATRVAAR